MRATEADLPTVGIGDVYDLGGGRANSCSFLEMDQPAERPTRIGRRLRC